MDLPREQTYENARRVYGTMEIDNIIAAYEKLITAPGGVAGAAPPIERVA